MNKGRKILVFLLCMLVVTGIIFGYEANNVSADTSSENTTPTETSSPAATDSESESADMVAGLSSDISISGVKVSGATAGGYITISFNVSGNSNTKKHYNVDSIEKVYPVISDDFAYSLNDEAYRITYGSANTLSVSYKLKAKDNLSTAYYLTGFYVVYNRKNTDSKKKDYTDDYYVTKSVNVKINAKKVVTTPEPDTAAADDDVTISMGNELTGRYNQYCDVDFTAKSSKYKIKSVMLDTSSDTPFVSSGDTYKIIRSSGTNSLKCSYNFKVKKDVASGYQNVAFKITYVKNKATVSVTKNISIKFRGVNPEVTVNSVPRVMVVGYTTDKKKIYPNEVFNLKLQIKNNASKTVKNIKFTLSTASGEFLPVSGASTEYVDSMAAKSTTTLEFKMQSSASLLSKSYIVTVASEYEDSKGNGYSSTDNVSIPVKLKDRISLTDITPPDSLVVGDTGDLSFSINNLGAASLSNVTVNCEGDGFTGEDSFVGNIAAGSTGYATVTLTGEKAAESNAKIIIKYTNSSGEEKVYKAKTDVMVMDSSYMDDSSMDTANSQMTTTDTTSKNKILPVIIIIVVIIIVAIIITHVIRKKKRLKKEQELMDDELL